MRKNVRPPTPAGGEIQQKHKGECSLLRHSLDKASGICRRISPPAGVGGRLLFVVLILFCKFAAAMLLIPMDGAQVNHLKAYGVVYNLLKDGQKVYWLLNYRGGSFALDDSPDCVTSANLAGVTISSIAPAKWSQILEVIAQSNMEQVTLEKAPRIAVYTPPSKLPWDDAVTMSLEYAGIPYEKVYDREVLTGKLANYDWLHLHHEDFTGQYSKFYGGFKDAAWYQKQTMELTKLSTSLGFKKVSDCKKAVSLAIRQFVDRGGFLFAMCNATNTLDISLASLGTDIVGSMFDGDGIDPQYITKLNFPNCLAFSNFSISTDPFATYFDNIDINRVNTPARLPAMDFELFDFSSKIDPVPAMLTQNHEQTIHGFYGMLTSFNRKVIKPSVIVMGQTPGTDMVQYIHGVAGKGQFAFLGGHDPEDYSHAIGDKPTDLSLHKNSPGYRLILNNVLFPAAKKKDKKT